MYLYQEDNQKRRKTRALRVRKKLRGTLEKPRLSVFKSNKHFYAQIIDDENSCTLVSYSTLARDLKGSEFDKASKASARKIGEKIAELAKEKSVTRVVFDRGQFKYHGLIAEFAEAARNNGLQF
jgi:large subunit ribosomal protein L18